MTEGVAEFKTLIDRRRGAEAGGHSTVAEIETLALHGQLVLSARFARWALLFSPDSGQLATLLSVVLGNDGWLEDAARYGKWAVFGSPENMEFLLASALANESLGRATHAVKLFERIRPGARTDIRLNRILADFLERSGHVDEARLMRFRHYESRGLAPSDTAFAAMRDDRLVTLRFNLGEDFGDIIHAARFLAGIELDGGAEIACTARLHRLLARSFRGWRLVETDEEAPPDSIDARAIPHLVGPPTAARASKPSLQADVVQSEKIRSFLKRHFPNRLLVGVAWRSRPRLALDPRAIDDRARLDELAFQGSPAFQAARSLWRKALPVSNLREIASHPGIAAISLQHDLSDKELSWIRDVDQVPIEVTSINLGGDLDNVASLINALDAVVCIPSTHAHLACALGKPTFVPIHTAPPILSMWPGYATSAVYPNLNLIWKSSVRAPDGRFETGFEGDWSPALRPALDRILALQSTTEIEWKRIQ